MIIILMLKIKIVNLYFKNFFIFFSPFFQVTFGGQTLSFL
ncbi:hypothetical protein B4096_3789 [Heyndrickxia coagulans]|nr:hypothetical protein B4096_3789 [Heyndrickxia coagulans]